MLEFVIAGLAATILSGCFLNAGPYSESQSGTGGSGGSSGSGGSDGGTSGTAGAGGATGGMGGTGGIAGAGGTGASGGTGGTGGTGGASPTCEPQQAMGNPELISSNNGAPIGDIDTWCLQPSTNENGSEFAYYCLDTQTGGSSVYVRSTANPASQLIFDGELCYAPKITQDGNRVVAHCRKDILSAAFNVRLYDRNTDQVINVTNNVDGLSVWPSIIQDNMGTSLILYTRTISPPLQHQIWLAKVNASNDVVSNEPLVKDPQGVVPNDAMYAVWSPDGKGVGFYSNAQYFGSPDGKVYPFHLDLDSGDTTKLSDKGSTGFFVNSPSEQTKATLSLSNGSQAISFWEDANNAIQAQLSIYFKGVGSQLVNEAFAKNGPGQGLVNFFASSNNGFMIFHLPNGGDDILFAKKFSDQQVIQIFPDGLQTTIRSQTLSGDSKVYAWSDRENVYKYSDIVSCQ